MSGRPGRPLRRPGRTLASWRPALRLARRDARRHLARTILAGLLIALPVVALIAFIGFQSSETPSRDRVLASIPDGSQALVTATALPREAPPFPQLPEGPPGPVMDDPDTVPADAGELASALGPGTELHEFWQSPDLIASSELGLHPGEQRAAGEQAERLSGIDYALLSTVQLLEAEPEALEQLAPGAAEGEPPRTPDELLVSRALADRFDLAVGDEVGFIAPPDHGMRSSEGNTIAVMNDSERGYRVSGIAEAADQAGPGAAGERAWSSEGWLSGLVAENPAGMQRHWVASGDEPVTWGQAKRLNEMQAYAVSRHVLTHYPSDEELYPVPVDAGLYIQNLVGTLAAATVGALLVLFLVTPAFAVSAEQSRRSLGLAAAAGASARDLRRTILAQGAVLGVAGGVAGAVLGLATSVGLVAWVEGMMIKQGEANPSYTLSGLLTHYPWWTLPLGVLLALGLGLLAALPPARTAAELSPVDALRDRRPAPRPRGRGRRLLDAVGGPALLGIAAGLGALVFLMPLGELPEDPMLAPPRSAPPAAGPLGALIILAVALAAGGLVLTVRAVVSWFGGRGRRSRPAVRLALRDAADHPSRTVPAALGVLFAVAAASYLVVASASAIANHRDHDGGGLAWDGTFVVSPQVPVSDSFDRLLAEAAVAEAGERFPEIEGSLPVTGVAGDSSLDLRPLMPEGRECTERELPHAASALVEGEPLRCVGGNSGAAYGSGYRFGVFAATGNTWLMDGDALRATRVEGAERAAEVLDAGGIVVNDRTLIDDDGTVRVAVAPPGEVLELPSDGAGATRVERLPGAFLTGMGTPYLLSQETAERLGADDFAFVGSLAVTAEPLTPAELREVRDSDRFASLVFAATPDAKGPLSTSEDPANKAFEWAPILLLVCVAVLAAAVSVLLSATQTRRDAATMHAVGAERGFLLRFGLARAGVILVVGVPVGVLTGLGIGAYQVAWNRHLEATGAWLSTVPVWGAQLGIALGVAVFALAAAAILARPPRGLARRALD